MSKHYVHVYRLNSIHRKYKIEYTNAPSYIVFDNKLILNIQHYQKPDSSGVTVTFLFSSFMQMSWNKSVYDIAAQAYFRKL